MAGPWEKYAAAAPDSQDDGPWSKYANAGAPEDPSKLANSAAAKENPGMAASLGLSVPSSLGDAAARMTHDGLFRAVPPPPATDDTGKILDMKAYTDANSGNSAPAPPMFEGAGLGMAAARIGANAGIGALDAGTKDMGTTGVDPSEAMHGAAVAGGLSAAAEGIPYVGKAIAAASRPIAGAGAAAGRAIIGAGSKLAGIDPAQALEAFNTLKSYQLAWPTWGVSGASKAMDEARQALHAQTATIPGTSDVASGIASMLEVGKGGQPSPEVDKVIQAIKGRATQTIQESQAKVLAPWESDQLMKETEAQLADIEEKISQIDNQRANHVVSTLKARYLEVNADNIAALVPELHDHPQLSYMDKIRSGLDAEQTQLTHQLVDLQGAKATGQPFTQQIMVPVSKPQNISIGDIDDINGMLKDLKPSTTQQVTRAWEPAIAQSRKMLSDVLQSTPEGQLLQQAEATKAGLATASQGRSDGKGALGVVGSVLGTAGAAAGVVMGHTVLAPAALIMGAMHPQNYYRLMGAVKVPGEIMQTLAAAQGSGKLAVMQDALQSAVQKNPMAVENLIRGAVLMTSKPNQQNLTDEEAKTLGATRVFDAGQIAAEKQRIKSDDSLDSIEKASALSAINRNGYITMEGPKAPAQPQKPDENDEDKVAGFYRSLKTVGK